MHIRGTHLNDLETQDNLQASLDESVEMEFQVDYHVDVQLHEVELEVQEQNEICDAENGVEEVLNASDFAVRMVSSFQSHTSMSDTMLENVVHEFEEFHDYCLNSVRH